ncbi:MAG: hypothetical protein LBG87_03655 [Spirochaetaceae bacterium]|nr:hypothetical protein [Spirochaetaceae bacterium]
MGNLRSAYRAFFRKSAVAKTKGELAEALAEGLDFSSEAEFRAWFSALPVFTQNLFSAGAFREYTLVPRFDETTGAAAVLADHSLHWHPEWKFNPALNIDFLPLYRYYGCLVTAFPRFLRELLARWLPAPAEARVAACRIEDPAEPSWDNSGSAPAVLPLFAEALGALIAPLKNDDREKRLRSGFKKRDIAELRDSADFARFPLTGDDAPDSAELAARFLLCMSDFKIQRPADGQAAIRDIIAQFFSPASQYTRKWRILDRQYLEYSICIDHLSRTPGYYLESSADLPASRKAFHEILLETARDGGWFSADRLIEYIQVSGIDFSFCDRNFEKSLRLKGDKLLAEGFTFSSEDGNFQVEGIIRHTLLTAPLFKAYCYIFAVLGILEITQSQAERIRMHRGKAQTLSPYSSLKAFRITAFGRWCLGLTAEAPPRTAETYQAIADRELLLVTVQGNSLERRVYLDKIGQRLGEDRWRISPGTFIRGCTDRKQISERIARFKTLIDAEPEAHWEELFQGALKRAGLFAEPRSDVLIYDMPADPKIAEELLRDPEIKELIRRVEGRMLAVLAKDSRKFFALLNEHGIAHF